MRRRYEHKPFDRGWTKVFVLKDYAVHKNINTGCHMDVGKSFRNTWNILKLLEILIRIAKLQEDLFEKATIHCNVDIDEKMYLRFSTGLTGMINTFCFLLRRPKSISSP